MRHETRKHKMDDELSKKLFGTFHICRGPVYFALGRNNYTNRIIDISIYNISIDCTNCHRMKVTYASYNCIKILPKIGGRQ